MARLLNKRKWNADPIDMPEGYTSGQVNEYPPPPSEAVEGALLDTTAFMSDFMGDFMGNPGYSPVNAQNYSFTSTFVQHDEDIFNISCYTQYGPSSAA
jgi:hypothetical protein